jgi:DNA-binding IclR family transcriptional regulator
MRPRAYGSPRSCHGQRREPRTASHYDACIVSAALLRGIDVLELLGERGEARLAEVASALGTSRATAFRVLATLQSRGYVHHSRSEQVYRLGPALKELAATSDSSSVVRVAAPAMAALRSETGETVNLAAVQRWRIVYVSVLDGVHALRMNSEVGEEVPPHATAIGKAILAALPPEQRGVFLGKEPYVAYTDRTITTRVELEHDLSKCAKRGYSADDQEAGVGSVCIGAPIIGSDGYPVAAISVSAIAARLPRKEFSALGRSVRTWADRISADRTANAAHETVASHPPSTKTSVPLM